MFGLCFLGKENETMGTSKEEYYVVPEYSDDEYLMDITEASDITIDISDLVCTDTIDVSNIVINTIDNNDLTLADGADIVFKDSVNDTVFRLRELLEKQSLQIEALTDIIGEMLETSNFDIEWNLDHRVKQKEFIKKLST